MKIKVKNNPLFADFLGTRLAKGHSIEAMVYYNKADYSKTYLIVPEGEASRYAKAIIEHMLRLIPLKEPDKTGFKRAVSDFTKSEVIRLS